MTTLQKTIIGTTIAAAIGVGVYEALEVSKLHEQNRTLRQQQAPLIEQLQRLQSERDEITNRRAQTEDSPSLTKDQSNELLRLRGEVGILRRQVNELGKVEEENRQLRDALHQMVLQSQQSIQQPITPRFSFMRAGDISFQAAHIEQVLKLYAEIANVNIDADQEVRRQKVRFAMTNTQALLTRSAAVRFLEQAFRDQAGVEITHPEPNVAVFRVRR